MDIRYASLGLLDSAALFAGGLQTIRGRPLSIQNFPPAWMSIDIHFLELPRLDFKRLARLPRLPL